MGIYLWKWPLFVWFSGERARARQRAGRYTKIIADNGRAISELLCYFSFGLFWRIFRVLHKATRIDYSWTYSRFSKRAGDARKYASEKLSYKIFINSMYVMCNNTIVYDICRTSGPEVRHESWKFSTTLGRFLTFFFFTKTGNILVVILQLLKEGGTWVFFLRIQTF